MKPIADYLKIKPMILIFWFWIAISLLAWAVSLWDGSLQKMMLAAADKSGTDFSEEQVDRDTMATSFIWISFAYFALSATIGGFLVYFSTQGHRLAGFVLVACALWWAYEQISFPFKTNSMYPTMINWRHWLMAFIGGCCWISILAINVRNLVRA